MVLEFLLFIIDSVLMYVIILVNLTVPLSRKLARSKLSTEKSIVVKRFIDEVEDAWVQYQPNLKSVSHLPCSYSKDMLYNRYLQENEQVFANEPELKISGRHFRRIWRQNFGYLSIPKVHIF